MGKALVGFKLTSCFYTNVALMPSYYIVSLVLYTELLHTVVLLFTFYFCIVTHAHTTHAVIYKLYVVENKKFSADSMCVCEAKWPAQANSTGVIASDATQIFFQCTVS